MTRPPVKENQWVARGVIARRRDSWASAMQAAKGQTRKPKRRGGARVENRSCSEVLGRSIAAAANVYARRAMQIRVTTPAMTSALLCSCRLADQFANTQSTIALAAIQAA
jgi:hypothetical protein